MTVLVPQFRRAVHPTVTKTYACKDCAHRLGKSPDTFRRRLDEYFAAGMPRPLPGPGQRRWDASKWEAWRSGYLLEDRAANDASAPADPHTLEQVRELMRAAYGAPLDRTGT